MFWKHQKKTRTQNLRTESDSELQSAERDTVAAPSPEPQKSVVFDESSVEQPEAPGLFSRLFSKAKPEQHFEIQPKWARGAVKACFVPLAKYQHPAWLLTDEEAEAVRPEMQSFMQAAFDKYVPSFLNRWASRHSEFANLLLGMGTLYYMKYQAVRDAMLAEEAMRKVVEIPHAPVDVQVEPDKPEPASVNRPSLCGLCHTEFPSLDSYNAHLPCKKAN